VIGDRAPDVDVAAALLALAGGHGRLLWHKSKGWASASFAGSRDEIAIEYFGPEASAAGEQLLTELDRVEFTLPSRVVADARIGYHTRLYRPQPRTIAVIELLIVED
jgi:hypothetical protein